MRPPEIPHLRLALHFRTRAPLRRPPLVGSALRGLLWYALEALARESVSPAARGRILDLRARFFRPRRPAEGGPLGRVDRIPPPWALGDVFVPRTRRLPAGHPLVAECVLVGGAMGERTLLVDAFALAPRFPFLGVPGALELEAVTERPPLPAPPPTPALALRLSSPLRLRREGREVGPERLDAATLAYATVHRLALLAHFHAGMDRPVDVRAVLAAARRVRLRDRELVWWDGHRASARQGRRVPVGGLLGRLVLDLRDCPGLAAFLAAARPFGLGKGTTLGLGRFALAPASAPADR